MLIISNGCNQAANYVAFSNRAMAYLKLKEYIRAEVQLFGYIHMHTDISITLYVMMLLALSRRIAHVRWR
jgi:hypothetical protein